MPSRISRTKATFLLLLALLTLLTPQSKADGILCNTRDFLGTYDTPGIARSVFIRGTTAYVADIESGLQIIDVSNPTTPIHLGSYDTLGRSYTVTVVGTIAYIADGDSGLQIIDISDCPPCTADLNNDNALDFFDISAFLTAFSASNPVADFTQDGTFDFFDIAAFLTAFSTGCP